MRLEDLEVAHHVVPVNGIRMHYVERGRGPLVVLLHGFPEMWWSWRHQLVPLAQAGFRVVAPDLRGYNLTDTRGPYDLPTLVEDVVQLIAALSGSSGRAHVVGHDWGGAVAWSLAALAPRSVDRLAILNSPHPALFRRALLRRPSQIRRSWYMFLFQLPRLPEWFLTRDDAAVLKRMFLGSARDRTNFGDEEIRPFRDNIQRPGVAHAMLGYYRALPTSLLRPDRAAALPARVAAETLLLWAMDDAALGFDDLVPGTERYVPALRVVPIERCGHFVQAERPDEVNESLSAFLGTTRRPR